MKIKAVQWKKARTNKGTIINKMSEGKHIFFELVTKVEQSGLFKEILTNELPRYQITLNKCDWLQIKSIVNLYENLEIRQKTLQDPIGDFQTWNDNEKKVFIWFVIFYRYYLEQDGKEVDEESYDVFSKVFFNRNPKFLHFHYLNLLKQEKKIFWTPDEDALLTEAVEQCEEGKWNDVSRFFFQNSDYEMFKCAKHCRERWYNHLDEKKKHGNWSPQEDITIFNFVIENGKKWSKLVPVLEGTRTEHMIKNRYNSLITKLRGTAKKEKEEQIIQRVLKHVKKQLANLERRKQKKEKDIQEKEMNFRIIPEAEQIPNVLLKEEIPIEYFSSLKNLDSNEKIVLSSDDETIKKEDSENKTFQIQESEEKPQQKEEKSEKEVQTQTSNELEDFPNNNGDYPYPMPAPMDPYMYGQYPGWYPMPYMMPYGYYPRPY